MIGCLFILFFYRNSYAVDPGYDGAPDPSNIQSLQKTMLDDQEIMSMITSLKNNPDFMKALDNPELMRQINDNDIEALKNNPDFLKLMDNQTVQQIEKKVMDGK